MIKYFIPCIHDLMRLMSASRNNGSLLLKKASFFSDVSIPYIEMYTRYHINIVHRAGTGLGSTRLASGWCEVELGSGQARSSLDQAWA